MNILVIGGTLFVGKHFVEAALTRGHRVTLFNRGKSGTQDVPGVERLIGDRDGGLEPLRGREWDCVLDTCGYTPRVVRQSADLLRDAVKRYVFISTISVYADASRGPVVEDAPLGELADPTTEKVDGETYGPLKAACERAVTEVFGERATLVRPGLIVGPDDYTDRFTYWPARIAQGGRVLAPAPKNGRVQIIDVRDLAEWSVLICEQDIGGAYNACGPDYTLTWDDFLAACVRVTESDAEIVWTPASFLEEQGVQAWADLPLWTEAENAGLFDTDNTKALAAGLKLRPLGVTIRDTLDWLAARPNGAKLRAGLSPEREAEVLAAWEKYQGA